jgi:hypothetical protein
MALAGKSAKRGDINHLINQLIAAGLLREASELGTGKKPTRVLYADPPPA